MWQRRAGWLFQMVEDQEVDRLRIWTLFCKRRENKFPYFIFLWWTGIRCLQSLSLGIEIHIYVACFIHRLFWKGFLYKTVKREMLISFSVLEFLSFFLTVFSLHQEVWCSKIFVFLSLTTGNVYIYIYIWLLKFKPQNLVLIIPFH